MVYSGEMNRVDNNKINEGALTKRVKTLVLQERYEDALQALDDVDVSKIKNISILCLVGEVYMGLERYDEAEQILLRVYEKSPNTRRILDLLTTLYIDKGEYSEAEYYYKEFIGVASRDLHRYILRYRLDKGKGERLSVLIDTLEKLKDYEYIEEWAYELAALYDASGETRKCIHECDEIVLWFGHGEYVDKAIALKCRLTGMPLPEMTTVEQHRVEEEAAVEEAVIEESAQSTARENLSLTDFDNSIDVDLIQRALDERSAQNSETAVEKVPASAAVQDAEKDNHENEDQVQNETVSAEGSGDEKSHIAQLFSSLMFGKAKDKEKHFDWSTAELDHKTEKPEADTECEDENAIPMTGLSKEDADFFGKLMGTDISSVEDMIQTKSDEGAILIDEDSDEDEVIADESHDEVGVPVEEDTTKEAVVTAEAPEEMLDEILIDEDDEDDEDEVISSADISFDTLFGDIGVGEAADEVLIDDDGDDEDEEDEISDDVQASDTVLDIFGSVAGVKSIQSQLAKTFTRFEDPALDNMDLLAPYDINFVVTGHDMSVKSQIAIGIAKALNTYGICDKNKLVRATAADLNGRNFSMIFEKMKDGCLIIEGADQLNDQAAGIISDFVQKENQDVAIVLEGEEASIKTLFRKYPVLHAKFLNIIHIGKYNENELVQLAEGYARKKGYELSKPSASVLKRMIRERMRDEYSVNYEDIMAIIEEAIASLEKRNMKNLFMTVLDNKYEEAAMFELQPEDFDNINIPD